MSRRLLLLLLLLRLRRLIDRGHALASSTHHDGDKRADLELQKVGSTGRKGG